MHAEIRAGMLGAMTPDEPDFPATPGVVAMSKILIDSYARLLHQTLVEGESDAIRSARLFDAPFVVVAHGTEPDPLLCYANRAGLKLWELSWEKLIGMPSRLTAEPGERTEREKLLLESRSRGYSQNYRGVRISATGRRFLIENVTVWNLADEQGNPRGQAATFSKWKYV